MSGHISTAGQEPARAGWNRTASAWRSGVGTITSASATSAASAGVGSPAAAAAAEIVSTTDRRVKDVSTMKPWGLSLSHIEGLPAGEHRLSRLRSKWQQVGTPMITVLLSAKVARGSLSV